ncbi:RNAse P Rpr2/Rpp21/SNM1 subunit domain-containing protein [Crassisporium funariophilum]|nr:RNAse P Rpr2/Rpp21/SNM1 subunit domain-containing protein [Crassisporium funariophilum]
MVKKQKDETPNVNATANRDIMQRLNFLYQASVLLQSLAPPSPPSHKEDIQEPVSEASSSKDTLKKRQVRRKKTTGDLARSYIKCMRVVGEKTTVKMDPAVKRSLCSGCSTTLVPGSTASVRVKRSPCHGHIIVYTCLHCKTSKRIPSPPTIPLSSQDDGEDTAAPPHSTSAITSSSSARQSPSPLIAPQTHMQFPAKPKRRKRKPITPHTLCLSARPDAGHAVFRGNERVTLDEHSGLGVCFA